jgi:hypothetical protein
MVENFLPEARETNSLKLESLTKCKKSITNGRILNWHRHVLVTYLPGFMYTERLVMLKIVPAYANKVFI